MHVIGSSRRVPLLLLRTAGGAPLRCRTLCAGSSGAGNGGGRQQPPMPPMQPAQAGEPQGLGAVSSADEIPTLKLYKDCMRLTYHIAAQSAKGDAMRQMIRGQFRANMHVEDPKEISRLKMLGVVGLQNYVIHEQTNKALDKKARSKKKKPT